MRITLGVAAALLLAVPLWADDKPPPKTYAIPYKLTFTNHVMVRAKINGKGPFNFIVDTGAPALFVATAVAEKIGVEPDKTGWGTFDKFELEGGLVIEKARGRIETPFQLEGMNGMGLAGGALKVCRKNVLSTGPAGKAGLQVGDVITEFTGRTVRAADDVNRYLGKRQAGDKVTVTVQRDGKEQELSFKAGEGL